MTFQTWTFLLFFLIFYPVYLLVKETRFKLPWLIVASYVFYGWEHPFYVVLLFYSTAFDYLMVMGMARTRWKKPWLAGVIINSLALLGFYKYGKFAAQNLTALLAWLGVPYVISAPEVILPVGISFYTFQSISYAMDYYRGKMDWEPNFIRYAAFVALFPQLVAGPIERARNILPQLRHTPPITREDLADGLSLCVTGLFKKVILADYLAMYVDKVFNSPSNFEAPALLLATFAFAWQIYFDFAGYTDFARGIARMMGLRLMLNFNNPYMATGLGDFWHRWHISLSTWFRDYVYIPLGGNRGGTWATYRNMFLTMLISGLWHGARWTFVIWGALHGLGCVLTRRMEDSNFYRNRVPRVFKVVWVFLFVGVAWIFFRAKSLADAWLILSRIGAFVRSDPRFPALMVALVFAVWLYQFLYESRLRGLLQLAPVRVGIIVVLVFCIAVFAPSGVHEFIYFQF